MYLSSPTPETARPFACFAQTSNLLLLGRVMKYVDDEHFDL